MKRKLSYAILICLSLLLVSSFVVYAAFTFRKDVNSTVNNYEITTTETTIALANDNTTVSNDNISFSFEETAESHELTITIKNNSDYPFSYTLGLTQVAEAKNLESAILMYYNDEFVGTVADYYMSSTTNDVTSYHMVELNEEDIIVTPDSSKTVSLKFELHNAIESSVLGTGFSFNLSCEVSTVDTNEYSIVTNFAELKEAILSVNSGMNKTIILSNSISLTENLIISNSCNIDLNGNEITFGQYNITINDDAIVNLRDTVGNTLSDTTAGTFIVDSANALLNVEDSVLGLKKITVKSFNFDKLMEIVSVNLEKQNGITSGTDEFIDLFKNNKDYALLITASSNSEIVYNKGIISVPTAVDKTFVTKLTLTYDNTPKELEIVVLGSQSKIVDSTKTNLVDLIISEELKHITHYVKNETNQNYLRSDLFLPTSIKKYNATIVWHSSDVSLLSDTGKVPEGTEGNVTLTAIIKINDVVYKKEFIICIEKETDAQKLERLISKISIRFTNIYNAEGSYYDLPTASNYQLECEVEDLGISNLSYEVSSQYNYISVNPNGNYVRAQLDTITFDTYAEIEVTATFGSGTNAKTETGIIKVIIDLAQNDGLIDEVLVAAQEYLDSVSVLQNMLNTRDHLDLSKESGNFYPLLEYNNFLIKYEVVTNPAYELASDYEIIIHPENFLDYETQVNITAVVCVGSLDNEASSRDDENATLSFTIPAAIHYADSTTAAFNDENLFYSIKMQVLNQSIMKEKGVDSLDLSTYSKDLFGKTCDHNNYILLHDIELCDTLVIEVNGATHVTNYHELSDIETIVNWAISGADNTTLGSLELNVITIDDEDQTIKATSSTVTPHEEQMVLKYLSKYPYFEAFWNENIYVDSFNDNILDEEEKTELESLLIDAIYNLLIEWASGSSLSSVSEYLDKNGQTLDSTISAVIGNYTADGTETISIYEEEAILRYCWYKGYCSNSSNHYYETWMQNVNYADQDISAISMINYGGTAHSIELTALLFSDATFFGELQEWITLKDGDSLPTYGTYFDKVFLEYYNIYFDGSYNNTEAQRNKETFLFWSTYNDITGDIEQIILSTFLTSNGYMTNDDWNSFVTIADNNTYFESVDGGNAITDAGWNYLSELLSAKNDTSTNDTVTADIKKIITWATSTSTTRSAYSSITLTGAKGSLNFVDVYNDGKTTISQPEYDALYQYLINNYQNGIYVKRANQTVAFIEKTLELYLNMTGNDTLTPSAKTSLSSVVKSYSNVDLTEYQSIISWIQGSTSGSKTIGDDSFTSDGLSTINSTELNQLITYIQSLSINSESKYLEKLNQFITLVTPNLSVILTKLDEYLSEIKLNVSKVNNSYVSAYGDNYYFYSSVQFTDNTSFEGLKKFINLKEIHIFGSESLEAFANSSETVDSKTTNYSYSLKANEVFNIIVSNMKSLEVLDMRYCNISNISGISNLTKLKYLDLSGNNDIDNITEIADVSTNKKLQYLNVANIFSDENLQYRYPLINKIFYAYYDANNNVAPKIIINKKSREVYYTINDAVASTALEVLFLLKEIGTINSKYMQLPKNIYHESGPYAITWSIKAGSLIVDNTGAYKLERTDTATASTAVVVASITIIYTENNTTKTKAYERYFNVLLPEIVEVETSGGEA